MRPTAALERTNIVKAGMLREYCNIQRVSDKGINENGFKTETWETYARVKCTITQETMFAQMIKNGGESTSNDIYFTIRFRNDVLAGDRIEYRNKMYKVFSLADKTGTKEYLEVRCQEIWD